MSVFRVTKQLCPPILWEAIGTANWHWKRRNYEATELDPHKQELDVYWNEEMAQLLEQWGEGTVWNEIQYLLTNCAGPVLDIACGTGKTMELNKRFPVLDIYGCDISDYLLEKAKNRGIAEDHLLVCDATCMPYEGDQFNYAYSIGSLEHFTEEGIEKLLHECQRVVKGASFHMVPVSRDEKNHGWVADLQSFHKNSTQWWLDKFQNVFQEVYVLDSSWHARDQCGKWFVCVKKNLVT